MSFAQHGTLRNFALRYNESFIILIFFAALFLEFPLRAALRFGFSVPGLWTLAVLGGGYQQGPCGQTKGGTSVAARLTSAGATLPFCPLLEGIGLVCLSVLVSSSQDPPHPHPPVSSSSSSPDRPHRLYLKLQCILTVFRTLRTSGARVPKPRNQRWFPHLEVLLMRPQCSCWDTWGSDESG